MNAVLHESFEQFLFYIIQITITTLGAIIINYIRLKIGNEKMKQYSDIAKIVVEATEQTLGGGNGADKKAEAIKIIKALTKNNISDDKINRLIEAAVYEMNLITKVSNTKEANKVCSTSK